MKHDWIPLRRENWSVSEDDYHDPSLPLITIGVLNHNRRDALRQTLDVLTNAVRYPKYEIILVDNGSTDGSVEMVRSEYPSVRVHEVGKNSGVSSRNHQTRLARGKYLFSYDDDTIPGSPAMVLRIVQHMEAYPDIDALSTEYYQPLSGITETCGWEKLHTHIDGDKGVWGQTPVEGAVCFRLESLRAVPGYDERLPYGLEGMDLGLQLFKRGYSMYLCPQFLTLHFVIAGRTRNFRNYAQSRHAIWIFAKHWPMALALVLQIVWVARKALAMVMHRDTAKDIAKGVLHGFCGMRPFFSNRPKLRLRETLKLKLFYLNLFWWG